MTALSVFLRARTYVVLAIPPARTLIEAAHILKVFKRGDHPVYDCRYPYNNVWLPYWGIRYRLPEPDPNDVIQFKHSASQFMVPALEMYHLLNMIAHSPELAKEMKLAASESDKAKVDRLVRSAGVNSPHNVEINPDGLLLVFNPPDSSACFAIRLSLCW